MGKMKAVVDSNILIYHLNAALPDAGEELLLRLAESDAVTSIITKIELLGWPGHSPDNLRKAEILLSRFSEQQLNDDIVKYTIVIRCRHRLKLPDSIIAATAIYLKLPLVTRNVNDFKVLKGLKLVNPFEI